jgi:hypothetical protein
VSGEASSEDINGLSADVTADWTGRELDANFGASGISATVTWGDDPDAGALALQVLHSFRGAAG